MGSMLPYMAAPWIRLGIGTVTCLFCRYDTATKLGYKLGDLKLGWKKGGTSHNFHKSDDMKKICGFVLGFPAKIPRVVWGCTLVESGECEGSIFALELCKGSGIWPGKPRLGDHAPHFFGSPVQSR